MKKIIFLLGASFCHCAFVAKAQNVGIGTTTPQATAILELNSTSKGFLTPKMTIQQILAIPTPAEGLTVYNLTIHKPVFYNGTSWSLMNNITMGLEIGLAYEGGIIVYVDNTGLHGLIAAAVDQSAINSILWGCNGTSITGASGTALGTGLANTNAIVANCSTPNIAARICADLVLNGYTDWYLPSRDEAIKITAAQQFVNLGVGLYYTSSEFNAGAAYYFSNSPGSFGGDRNKSFLMTVRAVRSF